MADVSTTHVAAWCDQRLRQVALGSVTREMNLLSNVFAVARKEWKWITESPTTDVARPKAPPPPNRLMLQEEVESICVALGWRRDILGVTPTTKQQRIALTLLFAIKTAMRAGEICGLKVKADDGAGRVARLPCRKTVYRAMCRSRCLR